MLIAFRVVPESGDWVDQLNSFAAGVVWAAVIVGAVTVIGAFSPVRKPARWVWRRFFLTGWEAVVTAPRVERERQQIVAAMTPQTDQVLAAIELVRLAHEDHVDRLAGVEHGLVVVKDQMAYLTEQMRAQHGRIAGIEAALAGSQPNGD